MKTIKYSLLSLFLVVISTTCIVSCGEDYSSPLKGIVVSDQIFETGTNKMTVTLGTEDLSKCAITSSAAWCSAAIQTSSVVITLQPNDTYSERQATITLTDPEDASTISFRVIQKQNDAILVDKSTYTVPEEGGEISVDVKSNVEYSVEIPSSANWLRMKNSSTRALTDSKLFLTAEKNNSGDEREAVIKLTYMKSNTSVSITITQTLTPYITIDQQEIAIFEEATNIEIPVQTNIELEALIDENWITDNGINKKEDFNFTQKLKASAMPGNSARSANVTFKPKNKKWDLSKTVKITQKKSLYILSRDIEIHVGDTYKIEYANNTNQDLKWKSSNTSVATVNDNGKITGVGSGTATITATTSDGKYSDKISVTVKKKYVYKAEAVDLGLSVYWSTYNLGAKSAEESGEFFAWAETTSKDSYTINNHSLYNESTYRYKDVGENISGTQYDAAHVKLGGGWRMPTMAEFDELLKKCTWDWIQINGVNGYRVIGPSGNSIFLPATGYFIYNEVTKNNNWIEYWSSTEQSNQNAYRFVDVLGGTLLFLGLEKWDGAPIRPVKSK